MKVKLTHQKATSDVKLHSSLDYGGKINTEQADVTVRQVFHTIAQTCSISLHILLTPKSHICCEGIHRQLFKKTRKEPYYFWQEP